MNVKYYYFTPTGKWKYEGEGLPVPCNYIDSVTHDYLRALNNGIMPGISTDGKGLIVVVVDEITSWPRLVREIE